LPATGRTEIVCRYDSLFSDDFADCPGKVWLCRPPYPHPPGEAGFRGALIANISAQAFLKSYVEGVRSSPTRRASTADLI